jgi:hypothetical protein
MMATVSIQKTPKSTIANYGILAQTAKINGENVVNVMLD